MRITPEPPFEITNAPDRVKHAVKGNIQVSVFPDVGEVEMKHRIGKRPDIEAESRWLCIDLKDKGVNLYVHGTHVVVSEKQLLPTFTTNSLEELMNAAFKALKPDKVQNRYVIDTPKNRKILAELFILCETGVRSRLLAEISYGQGKGIDS